MKNKEVEIKLSCPKNFNDIFLADLAKYEVVESQRVNNFNIYFDTNNFELKKQKNALRYRKLNDLETNKEKYVLTVKGSNVFDNKDGLSSRKEFNVELTDDKINLKENYEFLNKYIENAEEIVPRLKAVFYTDCIRNTYLINYEGLQIEVAIDNGKIYSDLTGEISPISELEMEMVKGDDIGLLNKFADDLKKYYAKQGINLSALNVSKANRGYSLLKGAISMKLNNSLNLLELDNHEQKILIDYIPNLINENQVDKIKSELVRLKRYVLNDLSENEKLWVDFLKLQNRENEIAIPKKENDNLEVFFQIIPSPSTISSNYLTINEYNKIEGHNEFPFDFNYEKENFLQYLIDSGIINEDETEELDLEELWVEYKFDYAQEQESYHLINEDYLIEHLYVCCIDEKNKFNKMLFDDIRKNGIEHTICKFIPKLSTEYLIEDNKEYDIKKLNDAFFDVCNKVLNDDKGLRFDEKGKLITCDYKRYPYLDRFNSKELKEFENFVIKDGKNYENLHKNYFEKINFLNSMLNSVGNITTLTQEDYSKFVQYGIDDREKISKNFSIEP